MLQQKEEAAADKLLVELENDFWKEMVPVRFFVSSNKIKIFIILAVLRRSVLLI